jgi:hypothetical protein
LLAAGARNANTNSKTNDGNERNFSSLFQLYELSEEPKRKEWLDDWLSFMHRIGR